MTNLFEKFSDRFQKEGIMSALQKTMFWLIYKSRILGSLPDQVTDRRLLISNALNEQFDGTVRYGPLKGFKLSNASWWGAADRSAMLLGLYEQEILHSLQRIPNHHRVFIDIGAADGYYGVGLIVAGMFDRSYCYEASESGMEVIKVNADLNGVFDRVKVSGFASKDFFRCIPEEERNEAVLFIDIEGGEFDLLTDEVLEVFKNAIIFVELHDHFLGDGNEKLSALESRVTKWFSIEHLTTTSRDLSVFEELKQMSDTDRWLICSEGRRSLGRWWRLDPIQRSSTQ